MVSMLSTRHPELVTGSITRAIGADRLEPQAAGQIAPSGIARLDQIDLPLPAPSLDPVLTHNGGLHRVEHLEMDEAVYAVPAGETLEGSAAMLSDARYQLGRDAGVERFAVAAGHDVGAGLDVACHRDHFDGRWMLKQVQHDGEND